MQAAASAYPPMTVAVTGASGLIGEALCALLSTGGHRALRMVRRAPTNADEVQWSPECGVVDAAAFGSVDAVVHLAGRNIASGRWTRAAMDEIRRSRVDATRALVRSLGALPKPPQHLICASAIGYYGDRGEELLTESSRAGTGFLVDVSEAWEREALGAKQFGARVAIARIGVVLSREGGMLATVLPIFSLGMGGPVGDGKQFISWISIDDAIAALYHLLITPAIAGPVNLVAPNPVSNAEFAKTLGGVLHRPAFMRVPAVAARLAAGAMADETVLASVRATPEVLARHGYFFKHATLEAALRHVLGRCTS